MPSLHLMTLIFSRRTSLLCLIGLWIQTLTSKLICIELSFKRNFNTTYTMGNTPIPKAESHIDLGLILSEDLTWNRYYKFIISRAYIILNSIICRTFASNKSPSTLVRLYKVLVRSHLLYILLSAMSPSLSENIVHFGQIQHPSTRHILNDYTSGYKD